MHLLQASHQVGQAIRISMSSQSWVEPRESLVMKCSESLQCACECLNEYLPPSPCSIVQMYLASIELRRKISGAMKRSAPTRIVRLSGSTYLWRWFVSSFSSYGKSSGTFGGTACQQALSLLPWSQVCGAGLHWLQERRYRIKTTNTN